MQYSKRLLGQAKLTNWLLSEVPSGAFSYRMEDDRFGVELIFKDSTWYYRLPVSSEAHGFWEGALGLFNKRAELDFRAVENFFRDSNERAAFPEADKARLSRLWEQWIDFLLRFAGAETPQAHVLCHCLKKDFSQFECAMLWCPSIGLSAYQSYTEVGTRCKQCLESNLGKNRIMSLEWAYAWVEARRANRYYSSQEYKHLSEQHLSSLDGGDKAPLDLSGKSLSCQIIAWENWLDMGLRRLLAQEGAKLFLLNWDSSVLSLQLKRSCDSPESVLVSYQTWIERWISQATQELFSSSKPMHFHWENLFS